ncbi:hypothetical protein FOZ60_016703 [Perkinsus olseni]|nr:hypothetical protein FOZ60_016703 [Perkinsus olseni]
MDRKVKENLPQYISKETENSKEAVEGRRAEFRDDIRALQRAPTDDVFAQGARMFFHKWHQLYPTLAEYFRKQWLCGKAYWYQGCGIANMASLPGLLREMEEYCQDEAAAYTGGSPSINSQSATEAAKWADRVLRAAPGQKETIYTDDSEENYLVASASLAEVVPTQEKLDEIVAQYYNRLHGLPCRDWSDFTEYKAVVQNIFWVKRHDGFSCTCYQGRSPPCIHAIGLQYLEGSPVGGFEMNELLTYGPKPRGRPR